MDSAMIIFTLHKDNSILFCLPEPQRHRETVPRAADKGGVSWWGGWRFDKHQQEGHGYQEGGRRPPQQSQQGDGTTQE